MVKNPQANAILERVHQVLGQMLRTSELDMANSISPDDVDDFLDNSALAIRIHIAVIELIFGEKARAKNPESSFYPSL